MRLCQSWCGAVMGADTNRAIQLIMCKPATDIVFLTNPPSLKRPMELTELTGLKIG